MPIVNDSEIDDSYKKLIVIEYDEPHHYTWDGKLRPYDIIRMNDIISHLGCTFMRYNEKTGELKSYGKNYEIISD